MVFSVLSVLMLAVSGAAPAATQPATVHFTIDPKSDVKPISRYIYGVNQPLNGPYSHLTYTRLGGNRWTAYNWVTNASNAGNDWHYQNDNFLGGDDIPGGAMIPGIENAAAHDAAILLTIPINGYVSADKKGDGDVRNSGPDYLQTRFRRESPRKDSDLTLTPDPNAPVVYEDEFLNWVKTKYPYGETDPNRAIFFSLDNEPDLWSSTHAEVHPLQTTYAELIQKTIDYATAVKRVEPAALVFGPANYGWKGYIQLQHAPDANGRDFQEVYLQALAEAEKKSGHRLLDALDVHWYPEVHAGTNNKIRITERDASASVAAARVQAPRSLWDPTYTEQSWIAQYQTHGPIRLIPRLLQKIARNYPGAKLSISEYQFGGWDDISGAIAQTDALGIFGRQGVFAANEWPGADREPFVAAAFQMFRDFDGQGGSFGDISVRADTDDIQSSSVYASINSNDPDEMTLVAINKTDHALTASVTIQNSPDYTSAQAYQLTAQAAAPVPIGEIDFPDPADIVLALPAYSVQTIRLEK